MELLLINHPLDCPICDKGGECPLQNQAMTNGRGETAVQRRQAHLREADRRSPPRCCSTASAACCAPAAPGSPSRSPATRSSSCSSAARTSRSAIAEDKPFESYFSGNTVQICPVGALTGAAYRFRARPFDLVSTPERLRALRVRLRAAHRLAPRQGDAAAGRRRPRGQRGVELRQGPLGVPLRHPARPADHAAGARRGRGARRGVLARGARARPPRGLRGRDAAGVGVLAGGRLTVEDAYAYAKFARLALGTNDIDFRARPHSAEEAEFLGRHVAGPRHRRQLRRRSSRRRPCCWSGSSPRKSRRSSSCGCARRSASTACKVYSVAAARHRGPGQAVGELLTLRAGRRGRRARDRRGRSGRRDGRGRRGAAPPPAR